MKIALLTDADVFAGTERHMLDLALALQEQGLGVEIFCPNNGMLAARARAAGVVVFAIEKGGRFDFGAILRLRKRVISADIDIVHAHNGRTALIATLAVLLTGRGSTVLTQHFLDPARVARTGWRGWLGKGLHRWILARAAHIVAISEAVRGRILDRAEVHPSKVTTVWNGIDDPAKAALRPVREARDELSIPANVPLIVCAARLEPEKAVPVLIEAMIEVRRQFPQARCVIAGEGRLRQAMQERIDSAGLHGAVELAGFRPDVLTLVQAADVFVLPSSAEPFGLALVEAMALRRPVIAVRNGGPLEIVVHESSGLLVRPDDAEAMAAAITRILAEPVLAQRLGEAARQRFMDAFTAQRMGREMAALYHWVKNDSPNGKPFVGQELTGPRASSLTNNPGLRR